MALPPAALLVLYLAYRQEALPAPAAVPAVGNNSRPSLAALVAVGIAVEFCVIYFGAELLATDSLSSTSAASAMSGFYVGILVGRLAGGRLVRRPGRTTSLLWASLALTTAGFALFWFCANPPRPSPGCSPPGSAWPTSSPSRSLSPRPPCPSKPTLPTAPPSSSGVSSSSPPRSPSVSSPTRWAFEPPSPPSLPHRHLRRPASPERTTRHPPTSRDPTTLSKRTPDLSGSTHVAQRGSARGTGLLRCGRGRGGEEGGLRAVLGGQSRRRCCVSSRDGASRRESVRCFPR